MLSNKFKLDNYDVVAECTFYKAEYGLFQWDIDVFENGELTASAVDFKSKNAGPEEATREFLAYMKGISEDGTGAS
ncbi:hypothetical protein [Niallia taxi]|uniref:hypothetical protein n=1 Tax=Niallia taxi TaxID=2499688 RepID=UPI0015F37AF3|nr:hypothetical protein [Niallia taxi]